MRWVLNLKLLGKNATNVNGGFLYLGAGVGMGLIAFSRKV